MGEGDLIMALPWLVFAVGLVAIGWRLAVRRGRRRRTPGPEQADNASPPGARPPEPPGPGQQAPRAPGA